MFIQVAVTEHDFLSFVSLWGFITVLLDLFSDLSQSRFHQVATL